MRPRLLVTVMSFTNSRPVVRTNLSGDWRLNFDDGADWRSGPAPLPGTPISAIPHRPPTGGWDSIRYGETVRVPGTTERFRPSWHGVSWWSREIELGDYRHSRLLFRAARLLAEVYLDHELIGYDLEGYTPFEIEIPSQLNHPGHHRLDVRITNPGGSTNWEDLLAIRWAGVTLPSSQDFGGVWQPVFLEQADAARLDDLYVRPNAACDAALIDVEGLAEEGGLLTVILLDPAGREVTCRTRRIAEAGRVAFALPVADPERYDIGRPALYTAVASLEGGGGRDELRQRFGFRSFDIVGRELRLNERPFYLKTSISWSLYSTGPRPTDAELADEAQAIVAFGQNAVTAHRRCANPELIDALEERGLLLYQEPGGLPSLRGRMGCGFWLSDAELAAAVPFAKLRVERLAKRDRSRAALVWWNLANECFDPYDGAPGPVAMELFAALRVVDNSRVTTWTSAWNPTPMARPFAADIGASFDFHAVCNWPSLWHPQVERETHAIRPLGETIAIAGESQNFTSLAGIDALAKKLGREAKPGSVGAMAVGWWDDLKQGLAEVDPTTSLGGPLAFVEATAAVQSHGVARLALHYRANPDVNGLAINGWHSHYRIGTMGITRIDRKPSFDPAELAAANQPLQIVLLGLVPDSFPVAQHCQLVLIDEIGLPAGETLHFLLEVSGPGGAVESGKLTFHAGDGGRVRRLGEVILPLLPAGDYTLSIRGDHRGYGLEFTERFFVVDRPSLAGVRFTLHDPTGELSPYLSSSGADPMEWRIYGSGPALINGGNLRASHTLFAGAARRSVVLLRPNQPRFRGSRSIFGDLEKLIGASVRPVRVMGDWIGGWGFTVANDVLPSLGAAGVWDWRFSGVFPEEIAVGLPGRVLAGAATFDGADLFSTGRLVFGASAVIVEHNGRETLLTTLPLVELAPTRPLATRVLYEMIAWLTAGQEGIQP
jgi:hypothetical protein